MPGKNGGGPWQEHLFDLFGHAIDTYRFCPMPLLFVKYVLYRGSVPIFAQADAPNGDLFGGVLRLALECDRIRGQFVRELAFQRSHFDHREIDRDTHGF